MRRSQPAPGPSVVRYLLWAGALFFSYQVVSFMYDVMFSPSTGPDDSSARPASLQRTTTLAEAPAQSDVWAIYDPIRFDPTKVPRHVRGAAAARQKNDVVVAPITQPPPPQSPAVPVKSQPQASSVFGALKGDWAGVKPGSWWPLEDPHSCNGFFGNGWTEHFNLLPPESGAKFNCSYHPGTTTHVCEAGMLWVDASKMKMVDGGEPQDNARHREEGDEIPVFNSGSFKIKVNSPQYSRLSEYPQQFKKYTVDLNIAMYQSMEGVTEDLQCDSIVEGTTMFIVRFEYHNLFHTATDWYDVYQTARSFSGSERVNVVFLDGHAKSPMDEVWEAWNSNVWYVKKLPKNTCFKRALFVPYGWHASINPVANLPGKQCPGNERVREFSDSILLSFGITPGRDGRCKPDDTKVMMVRREDYKRRPQHDGRLEVRLANEPELLTALHNWGDARHGTKILEGYFHRMSMLEQFRMAQDACVIVGAHGAGMSHILFARPGTKMVEVRTGPYMRPHFAVQSMWAGAPYTAYDTGGMSADVNNVMSLVRQAVGN